MMDKKTAADQLKQTLDTLAEDPFWAEEFRKIAEWERAIYDRHQRRPTPEEYEWYYETQNPFADEE